MSNRTAPFTYESIRSLYSYDVDGYLVWNFRPTRSVHIGDRVGVSRDSRGYYQCRYRGRRYLLHRLIYLWHYGVWPGQVDHIDRNVLNNRIDNLREAIGPQNNGNAGRRKDNTSGFKGVARVSKSEGWRAYISYASKHFHLGTFTTPEAAAKAYDAAAIKYFGEFAKLNFPGEQNEKV